MEEDSFEEDDLQDLQELLNRIEVPCSEEESISAEDDFEVRSGYMDSSHPNWREIVREELLGGI